MAIKSISTHLFALMLGMAVVTLWPRGERVVSNERTRSQSLDGFTQVINAEATTTAPDFRQVQATATCPADESGDYQIGPR